MKKIFLSAAVLAMMASACQNEAVVEQDEMQQGGQLITLEVNRNLASRTVLGEGNATYWSKGDQIYVCGDNGKVTGILTLNGNGGSSSGTFEGYIFGGTELNYVVFPVPRDGKIDMAKRNHDRLDAPMIGSIGDGDTSVFLKNVGAIVAFESNEDYRTVATDIEGNNISGGSYTFNPTDGTLDYVPGKPGVSTPTYRTNGENNLVYFPVATYVGEQPAAGTAQELNNVNVQVLDDQEQIVMNAKVNVTQGEIVGDDEDEDSFEVKIVEVDSGTGLEKALEEGAKSVKLTASFEIANELTVTSDLSIDLNGYVLTGKAKHMFKVKNDATEEDLPKMMVSMKNGEIINEYSGESRCVFLQSGNISLVLDRVDLETSGSGKNQPLTVGGSGRNIDVTVKNSTIAAGKAGYAITTFNPVVMNIENSMVKGWAALNIKGENSSLGSAGSVFNISGSTLEGVNNVGVDPSNVFSTIKIEDNNVEINVKGDGNVLTAEGKTNAQFIFTLRSSDKNLEGVNITVDNGSELRLEGEISGNGILDLGSLEGNTLKFPATLAENLAEEGWTTAVDSETGLVVVTGKVSAKE